MSRLTNLLFVQSPLPIFTASSDELKISDANAALGRLFGREPGELQELKLKDLCAFGEFARLKSVLERGPGPHTVALKLSRNGGSPFDAELRASLLDAGGENEWVFFCRDVTSEKEAVEALRRSEHEYRRMVENSPDGIALIQEGLVVFANGAMEKLLGLSSPDQLWAAEFESFLHPDDLPAWRLRMEGLAAGGEEPAALAELRLLKPDGSVVEAEMASHPITRPEGLAAQVTLRDVRKRKRMEHALKESEERYKGLADVAFDGVAVHFEGILLNTNRSFDLIFGYTEGDTKGRDIFELVAEEQREYFRKELNSGNVLELEGLRDDGRRVFVEASTRACTYLGDPAYVTAVRDISARKSAEQAMRHQAYYDGLTGLPNRLLFFDRLRLAVEQAKRDKRLLAVMFLDLDRFKLVNDSLGHNVGDLLLFQAAERFSSCLRKGDTVSRLGGDEFTILLNEISEPRDAVLVAEKIVQAINEPYYIQEQQLSIGVSIGICLYPEQAQDADGLITQADVAMYRAKENGRNNYQIWSAESDKKGRDRLGLESRLRKAVEEKEFEVHYQAKNHLQSGLLAGAESLVRWRHPERGLIMPDEFIPLAEETRLILPLGEWVLLEACRQAKVWSDAGRPVAVSVNLSAWQLHKTSLIQTVDAVLGLTKVDPKLIELEITETVAMKNPGQTLAMLKELKERGLKLALDDFGKGYSSLNYLRRFPVDTIKIDMAFIRDVLSEPKDASIVKAIILLGHNLGMQVLAEGVEIQAQVDFLRGEGCDLAQGYFYARPLPVADFEAGFLKFT